MLAQIKPVNSPRLNEKKISNYSKLFHEKMKHEPRLVGVKFDGLKQLP